MQLGDDARALAFTEAGLKLSDKYATLYSARTAALTMTGDPDEAHRMLTRYRELVPDRTIGSWKRMNGYGGCAGADRHFEALRRAGLPEC